MDKTNYKISSALHNRIAKITRIYGDFITKEYQKFLEDPPQKNTNVSQQSHFVAAVFSAERRSPPWQMRFLCASGSVDCGAAGCYLPVIGTSRDSLHNRDAIHPPHRFPQAIPLRLRCSFHQRPLHLPCAAK